MKDFEIRLKTEHQELRNKLVRLINFTLSDKFEQLPDDQQALLRIQLSAMEVYGQCLYERLEKLKNH